jgi:hypothetical protein
LSVLGFCCWYHCGGDVLKVAIIGTRHADSTQRSIAAWASAALSTDGFVISTGAADDIDSLAMAHCAPGRLAVYLPWASYNRHLVPRHARVTVYDQREHPQWSVSVEANHPNPSALTRGAFALHARNYGIVEPPCALVIALPGKQDGGTGQGMRIAKQLGIPLLVYRTGGAYTLVSAIEEIRATVERIQP